MNNCAIFINDVFNNILKLPLTSDDYKDLGGSRNIFYNCVSRDTKYMGDTCAEALKNLMLQEVKKNYVKRELLFGYFKQFLSGDVLSYIEKYPDNIEDVIIFAISKFTHKNNPNFPKKAEFYYSKGKLNNSENDFYVKSVSELYIKAIRYIKSDIGTANIIVRKTIETIIDSILTIEKIEMHNQIFSF